MNLPEAMIICMLGLYTVEAFPTCKEDNWDAYKIGKALQQGQSKEDLLQHLDASKATMPPERMDKIKGLIEDAYQLSPEQAEAWWKQHHHECAVEQET